MSDRSSIFDMIGPIMIGPSSSHTAGVVRIGLVVRAIMNQKPENAIITFYNSFAKTYEGHGSDRAIIAGLLGMATDDERIKESFKYAQEQGLAYTFKAVHNASTLHPNSVRVELSSGERRINILGISRGGGLIAITEIDKFSTSFSAQSKTLIITAQDVKGSIAFISNVISNDDCNIASMTVNRTGKNDIAKLVLEIDSELTPLTLTYLESLRWVKEILYLPEVS